MVFNENWCLMIISFVDLCKTAMEVQTVPVKRGDNDESTWLNGV